MIYEPHKLLLSSQKINVVVSGYFFAHYFSFDNNVTLIYFEKRTFKLYFLTVSLSLSLQFVAQPNCQQLLATLWYDSFPGWRRRHWAVKLVTCFIIGLLFPVFSLVRREEGGREGGREGVKEEEGRT